MRRSNTHVQHNPCAHPTFYRTDTLAMGDNSLGQGHRPQPRLPTTEHTPPPPNTSHPYLTAELSKSHVAETSLPCMSLTTSPPAGEKMTRMQARFRVAGMAAAHAVELKRGHTTHHTCVYTPTPHYTHTHSCKTSSASHGFFLIRLP